MKRKRNIFDRIGKLIPGYTGYADRSDRRKKEKKFRVLISSHLLDLEKKITSLQTDILDGSITEEVKNLEKIRKKLNSLSNSIEYSKYGYTSFFSEEKIKDEELDKIYNFDEKIFRKVKKLSTLINNDIEYLLVKEILVELESNIKDREAYINNFE